MTSNDIQLVQESWALVVPMASEAIEIFYEQLFARDPEIAHLFLDKDMNAQHGKLATALNLVVGLLNQPEALAKPLQELGARHVSYGASENDFATVGSALLATLELGLADRWSDDLAEAWASAWDIVASYVLTGFKAQIAA